jgi:hypothetical protein
MLKKFAGSVVGCFPLPDVQIFEALLWQNSFSHPELLWRQRHAPRLQRYFMYKPSFPVAC